MVESGNWFGNVVIWAFNYYLILPFWFILGYIINWFGLWQITMDGAISAVDNFHYVNTEFVYRLPWGESAEQVDSLWFF